MSIVYVCVQYKPTWLAKGEGGGVGALQGHNIKKPFTMFWLYSTRRRCDLSRVHCINDGGGGGGG